MTQQRITIANNEFELSVVRSKKRRRTVALTIKPPANLIVYAPDRTAMKFIETFIQERSSWILNRINELQKRQHLKTRYEYINGESFHFLGLSYLLNISENEKRKSGCELENNVLTVYVKSNASKQDVMLHLLRWYKKQAKEQFIQRINYWCQHMNIQFNKLFISSAKTRWGSCNVKNDIRLNWRLIMMPIDIIDYVIVHELSHVIHKNHSKRFWNLVATFIPDHKQHREQLKQLGRELLFF